MNGRKRIVFLVASIEILLWGAGLTFPAIGQEEGAALTCDQPVFHFGRRSPHETVTNTFLLRNNSSTTVRIKKVRVGCGCMASDLARDTLAPGETLDLTVRMSLAGRSGIQRKMVYVEVDDAKCPFLALAFEGEVEVGVRIEPERLLWRVGGAGESMEKDLVCHATGRDPIRLLGVECDSPLIELRAQTNTVGLTHRIQARLRPGEASGVRSAMIVVRTDHPRQPQVMVPVTIYVSPKGGTP